MSKKRKTKKYGTDKKTRIYKLRSSHLLIAAVFIALFILVGLKSVGLFPGENIVYDKETLEYMQRVKQAGLDEQRPLMPASLYEGRVARAYKNAQAIPEVLDAIYCHCRCQENPHFRHKNLLTCFTNDHASNCGICLSQMELAWNMDNSGKTILEIRDEQYRIFGKQR